MFMTITLLGQTTQGQQLAYWTSRGIYTPQFRTQAAKQTTNPVQLKHNG